MTTNNADFKVKKGLQVADGDVTLASDHSVKAGIFDTNVAAAGVTLTAVTLSADGTDTNIPINITPKGSGSVVMSSVDIAAGEIDGTTIGAVSARAITGTTITATTSVLGTLGGDVDHSNYNSTNVDINSGAIDGTIIGAASAAAITGTTVTGTTVTANDGLVVNAGANIIGDTANEITLNVKGVALQSVDHFNVELSDGTDKFTVNSGGVTSAASLVAGVLQATGTSTLTLVNSDLVTVNGTNRSQMTLLQANGTAGEGGTDELTSTERDYSEIRIRQKMGDGSIANSQVEYMGGAYIIENNTAGAQGTGQGVVFTVGASGAANTDSWAAGRQASTGSFAIGYVSKDYDNVKDSNQNPLRPTQATLEIDTSGNVLIPKTGATLGFVSNSQTTKIKGSTSASAGVTYQLPPAAPAANDYVLTAQTSGVLGWAASASGADGMGSGFTVSATTDTTATTITQGDDLMFAVSGGGLKAETTADGTVTHSLDIDGMTDIGAAVATGDLFIVDDGAGGTNRKTTVDRIATLFAGTGLAASSASISVEAAQTQITSVGTLSSLTVSGAIDLNSSTLDIDASGLVSIDGTAGFNVNNTTMSLDSTDTTNLTMTANSSSAKVMTIDAVNSGSGAASITLGSTSGTAINIGNATSEVTIGDNLTVVGDLTVQGTNTVISSTVINVDDKNIELGAVDTPSDTTADGGGITLKGATDKTIVWDNTNDNWTSNQDWNIESGKKFKINNTAVFESATQLTSTVVTSGLTTVGVLANGSIASGFGTISTGNAITTTAAITGGSLVADNITIDGNTISSTNSSGNIVLTPNGSGLVNIAKDDLAIAGTAVTTTATELNVLDAVTAGTVAANKAVVVDGDKDIASFRNLTATGEIQSDTFDVGGHVILDTDRASGGAITGATALATYAAATYTTAKYIYQIKKDTAVDTDVGEILITYEGTSNDVFITEYGMMNTGSSVGDWSAVYNSGAVELKFTPTVNGDHTYTILNTLLI